MPRQADVLLLDISMDCESVAALEAHTKSLLIVDHHKTSEPAVAKFPHLFEFDRETPASTLAWEKFQGGRERPQIYDFIADRERWLWALTHSREVNATLRSHPFLEDRGNGPQPCFRTAEMACHSIGQFVGEGISLVRWMKQHVKWHLDRCFTAKVAGYPDVPCCNCSNHPSEVHEGMRPAFEEAPFTATFHMQGKEVVWELRGTGRVDVGELAARLGGGGHRNAAGFHVAAGDFFGNKAAKDGDPAERGEPVSKSDDPKKDGGQHPGGGPHPGDDKPSPADEQVAAAQKAAAKPK